MALTWLLMSLAIAEPTTRGLGPAPETVALDEALYSDRIALVVGVNNYEDESIPPLAYARNDAAAIARVLQYRYGFEVVALYDEHATRASVLAALRKLQQVEEDAAVMVFWAGHGDSLESPGGAQPRGFLLPWDGAMRDKAVYDDQNIAMSTVKEVLGASQARHKLLVVDACFSGILTTRDLDDWKVEIDAAYARDMAERPVYQILTAGADDQPVLDLGRDDHSAFTVEVLDVLESATNLTTANDLYARIARGVRYNAGGFPQYPQFDKDGSGDFLFVPVDEGADPIATQRACEQDLAAELSEAEAAAKAGDWTQLHLHARNVENHRIACLGIEPLDKELAARVQLVLGVDALSRGYETLAAGHFAAARRASDGAGQARPLVPLAVKSQYDRVWDRSLTGLDADQPDPDSSLFVDGRALASLPERPALVQEQHGDEVRTRFAIPSHYLTPEPETEPWDGQGATTRRRGAVRILPLIAGGALASAGGALMYGASIGHDTWDPVLSSSERDAYQRQLMPQYIAGAAMIGVVTVGGVTTFTLLGGR